MTTTVILCTFNRCADLKVALTSLAASVMPESDVWEVLVVDNNSTDQTREVFESFRRDDPEHFRYMFEPRPGKAHALNSGIREARGEILVFTDDDVTFEPTWLRNLTAAFQDKRWAGAGGRIVLTWPSALPKWLAISGRFSRHPFPGQDYGPDAKELPGPPFGANMAFRRTVFDTYGGFRTDLGPSPDRDVPPHSEDTEFGYRLLAAGEHLRYEPSAVAYHPVTAQRLNQGYFLSWWFDRGRAEIRASGVKRGSLFRVPLRIWVSLFANILRWAVASKPEVRFYWKLIVWQNAGRIAETRRQAVPGVQPALADLRRPPEPEFAGAPKREIAREEAPS